MSQPSHVCFLRRASGTPALIVCWMSTRRFLGIFQAWPPRQFELSLVPSGQSLTIPQPGPFASGTTVTQSSPLFCPSTMPTSFSNITAGAAPNLVISGVPSSIFRRGAKMATGSHALGHSQGGHEKGHHVTDNRKHLKRERRSLTRQQLLHWTQRHRPWARLEGGLGKGTLRDLPASAPGA